MPRKPNHLARLYTALPRALRKITTPIIKEGQKMAPKGKKMIDQRVSRWAWGKKR